MNLKIYTFLLSLLASSFSDADVLFFGEKTVYFNDYDKIEDSLMFKSTFKIELPKEVGIALLKLAGKKGEPISLTGSYGGLIMKSGKLYYGITFLVGDEVSIFPLRFDEKMGGLFLGPTDGGIPLNRHKLDSEMHKICVAKIGKRDIEFSRRKGQD